MTFNMARTLAIQVIEETAKLRLEWDNRQVLKDNVTFVWLLAFSAIWIPATLVATCLLIAGMAPVVLLLWCVFGWFGTFVILNTLARRSWSEWIEVSPTEIIHGCQGLWAPKPKCHRISDDVELYVGRYGDESMITLGLVWTSRFGIQRRAFFGYWLAPKLKEQVFQAIEAFVESRNLPLELARLSA